MKKLEKAETGGIPPVFAVLAALILCAALTAAFLWQEGFFLASWRDQSAESDLDGDGRLEQLLLKRRQMTVAKDGREVWTTDASWKVEDFLLGDLDGDGRQELLLLVWKRGSYGPVKPFWVEQDETEYSQHIFIYQWKSEGLRPLWMSSRLVPEVGEWELLPNGTLSILTAEGEETVWGWQIWGLRRLDGERIPY